ncbi:MAG: Glycosyl transferase group 1 [Candidatus Daviesbacteria bacterium GW2011_GWA2_42_7]|nr:MAG: Glycosyl transferase group 1 [Candidatus Daviesbacteria bacterium GW2011_GWA1_42_6]KKS71225.1 MAG: Glycosyl transferase group 1 [Candidatus Daviesbacteria bacterium GW2011_GWA2_42_7]
MIKVAINSLPLKSGHKTRGIGTYTRSLLSSLNKRIDVKIQEFSQISEVKNADLIHFPFFDLFQRTLPPKRKFPTVVTVYDTTPLLFPEHYPPGFRGKVNLFFQKKALRGVDAVITVSDVSKGDISKYLGVNTGKIYPIHLAPADHFKVLNDKKLLNGLKKKYRLPENFALYMGSVNWNKNLINLAQACVEEGIDLVLAGKDFEDRSKLDHPERKNYREFLQKFSDDPKVHILGFIPGEELVGIVNLANVTLLPSFYEGFGLPILESQICGTPVITSNASSMPEVAGEGALLVNPYEVGSIRSALRKIFDERDASSSLVKKGFENVKKFSWEKTAEQTVDVYKRVLNK